MVVAQRSANDPCVRGTGRRLRSSFCRAESCRAELVWGCGRSVPEGTRIRPSSVSGVCGCAVTTPVSCSPRYAKRGEKGPDVNVATHLLADVLKVASTEQSSCQTILISPADPDRTGSRPCRLYGPRNQAAGRGAERQRDGRGWLALVARLDPLDLQQRQLPDPVAGIRKPRTW